ncbi:MAG: cupin domain-containing protein [Bacteroides sp.]|nr:cupin domain-containing protein [Roseburia sp.]MCM1346662.1 cupin domain-containing protein [Bacteroides sp.]MCM1421619.1 cupin domain-containing protein [Bacteroides sp.]
MIIDFNTMESASIPHFKGGEKELNVKMFFDGTNRIMNATLLPGASIGMHTHETSSETIFITEGCGTVIEDGEPMEISAGQCHYCPKGHTHSMINTGSEPLRFLAVVPEQ